MPDIVSLDQFRRPNAVSVPSPDSQANSKSDQSPATIQKAVSTSLSSTNGADGAIANDEQVAAARKNLWSKSRSKRLTAVSEDDSAFLASETLSRANPPPQLEDPEYQSSLLDDPSLPSAARDFRRRFLTALNELKLEAVAQIEATTTAKDVTIKINVSAVLKRAKSSPLTAYSPLHRDVLLPLVSQAIAEIQTILSAKIQSSSKPSIASLQKSLKQAREQYEIALSRLASQQLTKFIG